MQDGIEMKKVVFYDGVCNLCNWFVVFCIDRNSRNTLYFSSLQSDLAKQVLSEYHDKILSHPSASSVVFWDQGKIYIESRAVTKIVRELDGWIRVMIGLDYIPRPIADWLYRLIAKYRYLVFGKEEVCRIPNPSLRSKFLD
jgi:predicted DCC family thiol-disulfide oxidoreductase YuxK